MPKAIVFCADGTWNGPAVPEAEADTKADTKVACATNVFKLFLNLDGADEPETYLLKKEQERTLKAADGSPLQVAKYIDGVGDSENFLVKAMGGTMGAGIITRIVRGYTFISRNYEPGDLIYIIGFSRGAYTARALGGFIADKGLLDARTLNLADKENAYRMGTAVWYQHLRSAVQHDKNWLGRLEEIVLDLPHFVCRPPDNLQLIKAPIEAIAVWETVGALGIPEFTAKAGRIDAFKFANTDLSPIVKHGIQAIAVDERRTDFTPSIWTPDTRIVQALFPGAHADVGGGYPVDNHESGLSDCALHWMMDIVKDLGLRFSSHLTCAPEPDPGGVAHEPWTHLPWTMLEHSPRSFAPGLCVSHCLLGRFGDGPVVGEPGSPPTPYNPPNLSGYVNAGTALSGVAIV